MITKKVLDQVVKVPLEVIKDIEEMKESKEKLEKKMRIMEER